MQTGLVFNIQRYSVQDGPGIRTTVFLKGCPLRCDWCHNPEGISARSELMLMEGRCIRCGECRRACTHSADSPDEGPLPPQVEGCELCGDCSQACPTGARRVVGEEMTVEEVLATVLRDRVFFEESGGGVTFSGGEPLLQPTFLRALLTACHGLGMRTAVDTCGLAPMDALLEIAPVTGLFLYDLKFMDEELHRRYTGASNRQILKNLQALGEVHQNIWVRVPLVPGINDTAKELEAIARFTSTIPGVQQVNLLPFHRTGAGKFARIGRTFGLPQAHAPSAEAVAEAAGIFQAAGLQTCTGG